MSIEVMRQVLEALEQIKCSMFHPAKVFTWDPSIIALRAAIEQGEKQEPFGYFQYAPHFDAWVQNRDSNEGVPFYTAPRQWVGLTDEEIMQTVGQITTYRGEYEVAVGHAIEAKLREKNDVLRSV